MLPSLVLSAALLSLQPAYAVQPSGQDIDLEPQRIHQLNPHVQAGLMRSPAWRAFAQAHGKGWRARFDETTQTPLRMWGSGIDMGPAQTASQIESRLLSFLDDHADLFGFDPGILQVTHSRYVEAVDVWYIDVSVPVDGLPVYRGGLTARIKAGNLISIGAQTYPDAPVEGAFLLTPDQAIARAIRQGPAPEAVHEQVSAEAMMLPVDGADLTLRRTWMTYSRTMSPPGKWVSFVDAETGELLNVHNQVRFINGEVAALHHERTLDGAPLVESPMKGAVVNGDSDSDVTDANGLYTVEDSVEYLTDLDGDYVDVTNTDGDNGVVSSPGPDILWTQADATQAEIDSFVFINQVRDWGETVSPDLLIVTGRIDSYVNITSGSCNAYYDGDVNFYAEDGSCNNTGSIADVNYHEWGHGFHYSSLASYWKGFDGSLSEGAGDTVSMFQTGDHVMSPYFYKGGSGIRDMDNTRTYPDDFQNNEAAVHSNGLIFGGAMWDLWHILMDAEGVEQGTDSAEAIFAGLLRGGPDVPNAFDEALVADDDNGDLADGTPHECEIIEAFGQHGLGPLGNGTLMIVDHEPLTAQTPLADHAIDIGLWSAAPACFDGDPVEATIHYRVNGNAWQEADLQLATNGGEGLIPAGQMGDFIEYYITVDDASGAEFKAPEGANINPFSFFVGDVIEVVCFDFEDDDGGFTHQLLDGDEQEGADDWQWGRPRGLGGDPESAASGKKIWGNDLGSGEYNGEYQNEKKNRLQSPVIDTLHYTDTFLDYQRWLHVEDGLFDQARIQADGKVVWANHGTDESNGIEHHKEDRWVPHAVDLQGHGDDGALQVSWTITSDGGLTFGGWNIDDVCVYAPATADNRLGIADFTANTGSGRTVLKWTNPAHAPLEQIVVVRNDKRLPEGPWDGVVVHTTHNPELGAEVQAEDLTSLSGQDAYYAAYPTDGETYLSWTRLGFNADQVDSASQGSLASQETGGCGCATGHAAPSSGLLLAFMGLIGLRRRHPKPPSPRHVR